MHQAFWPLSGYDSSIGGSERLGGISSSTGTSVAGSLGTGVRAGGGAWPFGDGPLPLSMPPMSSIGSGKTTVVFFSAPISVRVCK
jgi:hypothetical protein